MKLPNKCRLLQICNFFQPGRDFFLIFAISRVRMCEMTTFSLNFLSGDLASQLAFIGDRDRDDAVQEAWLAHLQGRDPLRAIETFLRRERRHRERQQTGLLQQC